MPIQTHGFLLCISILCSYSLVSKKPLVLLSGIPSDSCETKLVDGRRGMLPTFQPPDLVKRFDELTLAMLTDVYHVRYYYVR